MEKHTNGRGELLISTDCSRLDSGWTSASVAWGHSECKTQKTYLSTTKEVFNIQLYAIGETLVIVLEGGQTEHRADRQKTESH